MSFTVEITDRHLNQRVCLRTSRRQEALRFAASLRANGTVSSVRVFDAIAGRFIDDDSPR